jgi:hypothetical protein
VKDQWTEVKRSGYARHAQPRGRPTPAKP